MNTKQLLVLLLIVFSANTVLSQSKLNKFLKSSDTLNVARRNVIVISEGAIGGLSLLGLLRSVDSFIY